MSSPARVSAAQSWKWIRKSHWHLSDLIEESWRRLGPQDLLAAILTGVLAAAIVSINAIDLHRASDAAQAHIDAGITVFEITAVANDDGVETLDPFLCSAIATNPSVIAAGGIRGADTSIRVRWEPSGLEVQTLDLTHGALAVWWPEAPLEGGFFAGVDLAERTGIGRGSTITVNGQAATITGVLPETVRPSEWRSAILRIVPPSEAGNWSCWMRLKSNASRFASNIAAAAYPTRAAATAPYAKANELSSSPESILKNGPSRWIWWAALGAGAVINLLLGLTGRREAAVYRATGSRYGDLWAMATLRAVVVIAIPGVLATSVATAVAVHTGAGILEPASLWYAIQPVCLYLTSMIVITPAITTICALGSITNALNT
jgi:hypothetical protein